MKPKILLINDVPGWAFDIQCQGIKNSLSDVFDFEIKTQAEYLGTPKEVLDTFNLFYFCSYYLVPDDVPKEKTVSCLVGVHGQTEQFIHDHLAKCVCANYTADYLWRDYVNDTRLFYCPYGIDTQVFSPEVKPKGEVFKIGFAGNHTLWSKRFDKILGAVNSIPGAELEVRTFQGRVNYAEMPKFYQGLDAYVCFSSEEGFCYPLLESASCGLPIVSSRVGCADKLAGTILVDTEEELKKGIEYLMSNYGPAQGFRNRNSALNFSWDRVKVNYKELFDFALKGAL